MLQLSANNRTKLGLAKSAIALNMSGNTCTETFNSLKSDMLLSHTYPETRYINLPSFPLTLDHEAQTDGPWPVSLAREAQLLRANRVPMMLGYTGLLNSRHQFLHLSIALDVRKEYKIHDFT